MLADLVGHIIPIQDAPHLRLNWKNLRSLCERHNAQATSMEEYARANGLTDKLPEWCRDPKTRPLQFRPIF